MITIENAYKYYDETCAFRVDSLTIPDGQIVGLLGENGAGKSSLLKALMGLTPCSGDYLFDGRPATACYEELSFITEEGSWFAHMTPAQYGAFLLDFFPHFDAARYDKLLSFFELPVGRPIRTFSNGQQSKLEVAAGFSKGARYIIMDEPFLGKDLFTRRDFLKLMASSLHADETILLSTHQIDEIEHFIDRAVILHQGRQVADLMLDDLHAAGTSLSEAMQQAAGYDPARLQQFDL